MQSITVIGIDEFSSFIDSMLSNGSKIESKAASQAITPLAQAYRSAAPTLNANRDAKRKNGVAMKRGVFKRVRKPTRKKDAFAKAGFNVGQKKNSNRRAFHAHLPILGTKLRRIKTGPRAGMSTGRISQRTAAPLRARIRSRLNAAIPKAYRKFESVWVKEFEKEFVK